VSARRKTRADIVPNLIAVVDAFFEGTEGTKTDPGFIALAERIAGKRVTLIFLSGDAFEEIDDNYYLPPCAYTEVQP
jgi:hypothetical protein